MLVVPEAERLERQPHPPRMADTASHLLDTNLSLRDGFLGGRLRPLGSPPHVCSRHVLRPPSTWRVSDIRGSRLRYPARVRSVLLWSAAEGHSTPPVPCCADSWSQG